MISDFSQYLEMLADSLERISAHRSRLLEEIDIAPVDSAKELQVVAYTLYRIGEISTILTGLKKHSVDRAKLLVPAGEIAEVQSVRVNHYDRTVHDKKEWEKWAQIPDNGISHLWVAAKELKEKEKEHKELFSYLDSSVKTSWIGVQNGTT